MTSNMDCYENLAQAIILQAVKDYRRTECNSTKAHIIRFFCSDWFKVLTNLNCEVLISKLKEEKSR